MRPLEPGYILDVAAFLADGDVTHRDELSAALAPVDPAALAPARDLGQSGALLAKPPRGKAPVEQVCCFLGGAPGVCGGLSEDARSQSGEKPITADVG